MDILIVAATEHEVAITRRYLSEKIYQRRDCNVHMLITGVGLVNTTYALSKYLAKNRPDLAIQAGIGGSFHPFYPPGSVVVVREEIIGDLGVEEKGVFIDVFDMNLADNTFPFSEKMLINTHSSLLNTIKLNPVRGITINEITTHRQRIEQMMRKYNAMVESMEGAAFHYVCLQEYIPFVQIRAVSNFVGERDKTKWQMTEAIANLNRELIVLLRPLLCH